jgi:hypothetical protein
LYLYLLDDHHQQATTSLDFPVLSVAITESQYT